MIVRLLAALLFGACAAQAHAATIEVKNCSGARVDVYSYNNTDTIHFASFATVSLDDRGRGSINCATDTCKLRVQYGPTTNGGWASYVYSWGVCTRSPSNAELEPIERCTC